LAILIPHAQEYEFVVGALLCRSHVVPVERKTGPSGDEYEHTAENRQLQLPLFSERERVCLGCLTFTFGAHAIKFCLPRAALSFGAENSHGDNDNICVFRAVF
jgi:hypothetical protein